MPTIERARKELIECINGLPKVKKEKIIGSLPILYRQLVLDIIDRNCINNRHILALSPLDPHGEAVFEKIGEIAEKIYEAIRDPEDHSEMDSIIITKIQNLLLLNTMLNTRELNESPILELDMNGRRFSPKEVYQLWREVKTRTYRNKDLYTLALGQALGIFNETKPADAIESIEINAGKAWNFLDKIFTHMNSILKTKKEAAP
jgi:hypothetical protein